MNNIDCSVDLRFGCADSWNCGDFRGKARVEEEDLCSTMLITGPPGVGKTASVYACAQELGFKVSVRLLGRPTVPFTCVSFI